MNKKELTQHETGERLETFIVTEVTMEHLHRYAFATNFVKGKKVLDIACGEGYGTNLLSQYATQVIGVDIDENSIKKATAKYKNPNITFKQGSITKIPIPSTSIDIVVSFETLEHLSEHDETMKEIKRVLIPSGLLIISTPDKFNYSNKNQIKNPFHVKELYEEEFRLLIKKYFKQSAYFKQKSSYSSVIIGETICDFKVYKGNYEQINTENEFAAHYHIALSSDTYDMTEVAHYSLFNYSLLTGLPSYRETILQAEKEVQNSFTYKVGHFILAPFKALKAFTKKK